ncbi:MAG: hypothetical protein EBR82_35070 [Caulobacteraceae bacterium]|nr:hypothetical protein [Caulobacteraceae bacterium]
MTSPLDPTQFTRESAERIANVVRAAELASPAARPLNFERVDVAQKAKLFRVCTFTGAWSIGGTKTVTLKNRTNTPNTLTAINLFLPVPAPSAATDCAIAKDGTAWYLIDVPLETATAVFVGATQSTAVMRDVTLSASLNTSACTITIGKTLVTTSVTIASSTFTSTFIRFKV